MVAVSPDPWLWRGHPLGTAVLNPDLPVSGTTWGGWPLST